MPLRKKQPPPGGGVRRRGQNSYEPPFSPPVSKGVVVTNGGMRAIVFDSQLKIRRRFLWAGEIQFRPPPKDPVFADLLDDDIQLWPPRIPPDLGEDGDLLGGGPIELTPFGPRQPGMDDRPERAGDEPPENEEPADLGPPIELDLWGHIPPAFPPPDWLPSTELDPDKPNDFYSSWNPCDLFHPLGPFGPFVELPDTIELIFPRAPWLGPYQPPLERALFEALREFLKALGKAEEEGTIQGRDWEKAGRRAGQIAAKALWDYIQDRLEETHFGGDFNFDSICEFARRRPWLTGVGVVLVAGGYGLYLGDRYRRKGKLKVDFGDFEFEYDGETGDWSVGVRFKFKF